MQVVKHAIIESTFALKPWQTSPKVKNKDISDPMEKY